MAPDLVHCTQPYLRQLPRKCSPSIRSFTCSSTRRKHGALPTFGQTSSPELDTLLSTFRTNVFLPSHLLKPQKALVYKTKRQSQLTGEEPVTVSLSGSEEVHTLKPLNQLTDEPNMIKGLLQLLDLMKEKEDWACLPGFLEGVRTAGRKVGFEHWEKIIRRAAQANQLGSAVECARRVDRTGLSLTTTGVVREFVYGVMLSTIKSDWSEEGVERAARHGEGILEMVEDPRHANVQKPNLLREASTRLGNPLKGDPKRQPDIVGAVMGLVATRASRYGNGKDNHGKVERYARRVVALWKYAELKVDEKDVHHANYMLTTWAPVWYGIQIAKVILGENSLSGRELQGTCFGQVQAVVKRSRQILASHKPELETRTRGENLYEALASASK